MFISFTRGVLMPIDAMEAFLHTLRLHGQNKIPEKILREWWEAYFFDQVF